MPWKTAARMRVAANALAVADSAGTCLSSRLGEGRIRHLAAGQILRVMFCDHFGVEAVFRTEFGPRNLSWR